ncbi:hypothetical protein [Rubrobacter xylanophilus]|nr:hypothetical protein [Rubrobacter xylanophilus]
MSRGSPGPVADILTGDEDSFGCGVATWTVETLISRLERRGEPSST